jgi:hypothetical protein
MIGKWARRWKLPTISFSGDGGIGWGVDQIAEDLAGLRIGIPAHPLGHESIQTTGDDEQVHVEVDFEPDCRGEGIHVEEADGVGEGVFDEHPLSVASDELGGGSAPVVSEEKGWLVVARRAPRSPAVARPRSHMSRSGSSEIAAPSIPITP